MKRPEWPGITVAVGVLLLIAIASDLSKWQSILAAIIAFGGGALAYRGAMAKVGFDREQAQIEKINERLGLLLRLRHSIGKLHFRTSTLIDFYDTARRDEDPMGWRTLDSRALNIGSVPELNEAWNHLQMIPTPMITPLAIIRDKLPELTDAFAEFDENQSWKIGLFHGLDQGAIEYMDSCRIVRAAATECLRALDHKIDGYQAATSY